MMCGDRWLTTGSPWDGDEMTEREQFERWIIAPPYEHTCERVGGWGSSGAYKRWETQLAWEAWQAARATPALPQVPEGMAIVPVDAINRALHGLEHLKADIQARSKMQEDYQEGVVMVGAGAWHGLCSAILMLAAAKEKGE